MKITSFDRQSVRQLRDFIDEELQTLGETLGVQIKLGSGRFTPSNVTFKLEAAIVNANGVAETKQVSDFKQCATMYGLAADDLGRKFNSGGRAFEIVGANPKSRVYPILAKNDAGKVFKFAAHQVKNGLLPRQPK